MISIYVSVIRGVASRSIKSINESIVLIPLIPLVDSDPHHKMRVRPRQLDLGEMLQAWIPTRERSRLLTHIAATGKRFDVRADEKLLLVISGDRILGASPKRHLVCWTVGLTRYG